MEGYNIETGSDVWQLAIMIVVVLSTKFPWEKADITDPLFTEFIDWQKRKTTRVPKFLREFTPRVLRMFRRLMEIKPTKRYPVTEVRKYLKDRWLIHKSFRSTSVYVIYILFFCFSFLHINSFFISVFTVDIKCML